MKKFNIVMLALVLALSCLGTSWAESLTLEECISRAIGKNPELLQAKANMDATEAQKAVAGISRRFKLDGSASFKFSNNVDTNALMEQNKRTAGGTRVALSAQQLVFDGGKSHLQLSIASKNALAAEKTYEEMKNQIIANVRDAYYNLNKATREKAVEQTRYNNYKDRLSLAQNFFNVGSKAKIEVTKAEADLAKAKLGLVSANTNEKKNQATLAAAIGDPLLDVTAAQDALELEKWKIDMESAVSKAMENRQEIKAQEIKVASAETNLLLKRKGHMPEIYLTAGLDSSGKPFSESNSKLEGNDAWRIGANLNVPILDGSKTLSESRVAKAQVAAEKAALDKIKNEVALEVRTAWVALEQSEEAVTAAREQERFAKDTHSLAKIRYKAGASDYLEFSDAIEGLSEAQKNVINSLYNCKNSVVILKKAMGEYK
ncbi:MAG: TolC family protein [Synergistaceae bacterium]|nr:TolC family protein [Synergistaceae bacterium]